MSEVDVHRRLYESVEIRAAELGYDLQSFWLGAQSDKSPINIERVLLARGIRSLLVASQYHRRIRLKLDWECYSVLSVSFTFSAPRLDYVAHDHHSNVVLIMQKLRRLGYRRVSLLLDDYMMTISEHRWLAGYLVSRELFDWPHWIAPAIFKERMSPKSLKAWYRRERPDAIITDADFWNEKLVPILGLECPRDVGVALISVGRDSFFSGIVENAEVVGATAAEQLVSMDQRDNRGLTNVPRRVLVPGNWNEGLSLRKQ
tara:strand:- start:457 stop:1233 length:777 start_codon:yes stop_codon:yes gene_type:complete